MNDLANKASVLAWQAALSYKFSLRSRRLRRGRTGAAFRAPRGSRSSLCYVTIVNFEHH